MYFPDQICKPIINIIAKISLREITAIDIQNNVLSFHYKSSSDALQAYSNYSKKLEFINKEKEKESNSSLVKMDMPAPDSMAINALNEYDQLK